ncbi:Tetratricopeptide repeat protein 36-like [Pseudocercospora fuligena]|uniref:Tetratricopeptide repeat protein 36-like n=1 Tax=Pseudocercospora fuligena TaxID=685502 RepID=A0A8H6VQ33_9PEZI|nr:Tetratricopeptide repeat protein 36-like [Pseudocercospora fuligena]
MSQVQLSKADAKVLAQVFDPESAPTKVEVIVDPDLPADRHVQDNATLSQLKAREKEAISLIEDAEKQKSTKETAYRDALAILDNLIETNPNYASARNNRAQLRRWMYGDRNTLCQSPSTRNPERQSAAAAAVTDLKSCIEFASPARQQDAVSPSQGRLLAQAFTQLGALYYAASKDVDHDSTAEAIELDGEVWSQSRFEEEASRLFYLGGLYGNEVAKALAVHTNPHAKLCGSIVKEAMRKELAAA